MKRSPSATTLSRLRPWLRAVAGLLMLASALPACNPPPDEPVTFGSTDAAIVTDADAKSDTKPTDTAPSDIKVDTKADTASDAKPDTKPDTKPDAKPGDAIESCNFVDDDGDGIIDEQCQTPPNLRPDQAWIDFGAIELQATPGPATTKSYNATASGQGTVVFARDPSASLAYVWAETLVSPAGMKVLSPANWMNSYNRGGPGVGAATALVGMAPQVSLAAGPWSFGFTRSTKSPLAFSGTPTPGWLFLGALARPEIAGNKMAILDLDVFVVGGTAGGAAALKASVQWKQISKQVETAWSGAKLQLGNVEFIDLGGDDGKKYLYLDNVLSGGADNEFAGVYAAVGKLRPKSAAATVVLVSGIYDQGLPVAAGLSQLAGVPGLSGSRLGGMAIAIDPTNWQQVLDAGPSATTAGEVWGVVLAHEIGHFLGMWHTDEYDGSLHDPLDDTPSCTKAAPVLTPEVCPIQAKYLMFWSPKGTTVTTSQTTVVRRHPALRQP